MKPSGEQVHMSAITTMIRQADTITQLVTARYLVDAFIGRRNSRLALVRPQPTSGSIDSIRYNSVLWVSSN